MAGKFELLVDGKSVGAYDTLDDALKKRNELVRDAVHQMYDNDEIDKYAAEDWLWNLEENKNLEFYIDEGPGISFDIEEKYIEEDMER